MKVQPVDLLLVAAVGLHLYLAPYTKVEESFTLQAVHDIVNFGVFPQENVDKYDHKAFPGVVPRTFVGALLLAAPIKAAEAIASVFGHNILRENQFGIQLAVRLLLGLANVWGLVVLRNSIEAVFRPTEGRKRGTIGFYFPILLCTQFHLMYYSTRTLPNFVVLPLVNYALGKLVRGDTTGLTWLGFAGAIFRTEVGLFGTIIALVSSLGFGQSNAVSNGVFLGVGALFGVFVTLSVDSYFWGSWLVPEFEAFKYNVFFGNAAKWGTEPFSAYFSRYLANFFRPPHVLVLSLLGFFSDPASNGTPMQFTDDNKVVVTHPARNSLQILVTLAYLFVLAMLRQPHKEWRFIVYIVPVVSLAAANGFADISWKWLKQFIHKVFYLVMWGSVAASLGITLIMSYASSFNYPGGEAITWFNANVNGSAHVHMDVFPCMSGISKFTQLHNTSVVYDKTESEPELAALWNNFTHLITERDMATQAPAFVSHSTGNWELLHTVKGFHGVNVMPLLQLANSVRGDRKIIMSFVSQVLKEAKAMKADSLHELVRSLVLTKEAVRVYRRLGADVLV